MAPKKSIRLSLMLYSLKLELAELIADFERGELSRSEITKIATTELKKTLRALKSLK